MTNTALQQMEQNKKSALAMSADDLRQNAKISTKLGLTPSPSILLATFALWLCLVATNLPQAKAMPLQMLRMYSSSGEKALANGNPALPNFVEMASSQQSRPHALLSRKLRQLSNAFLAEEGAKIRQQFAQEMNPKAAKRANEFEVEPEEEEHEGFRGRDLLLNREEEAQQKQKEHLPAEMGGGDEEGEDSDSAVLAAAAAAGLLRQERNEPNVAVPKMYARHIGDLGGTMFRFGRK